MTSAANRGGLGAIADDVLLQAWMEAVEQLSTRRAQLREEEDADTRYDVSPDPIEQLLATEARRERQMFAELRARGLL